MRLNAEATAELCALVAERHETGQRVTATDDLLAALQDAVDAHARLPLLEEVLRVAVLHLHDVDHEPPGLWVDTEEGGHYWSRNADLIDLSLTDLRRAVEVAARPARVLAGQTPLFVVTEAQG